MVLDCSIYHIELCALFELHNLSFGDLSTLNTKLLVAQLHCIKSRIEINTL